MAENTGRNEIYANAVRAGKRTYFFDVKETRKGEYYLTLTESKRRFNKEQGKFFYEKHKIFLYKEDFEKFSNALEDVMEFIRARQSVVEKTHDHESSGSNDSEKKEENNQENDNSSESSDFSDINFDDLNSGENDKTY
ncbi:MAG: PUR family DNA/RNA-binding protein [Bacteroidales bacterium]|nr:PUR family DNA/RNA-binding protein [Bacteroidales bacterium]